MSLQQFASTYRAFMLAHPELGYKISGIAKVVDPGNSIKYSVSLIPKSGSLEAPERYFPIFQALQVDGYSFVKVQTLEFESSLSLPKPNWRIQVFYKI